MDDCNLVGLTCRSVLAEDCGWELGTRQRKTRGEILTECRACAATALTPKPLKRGTPSRCGDYATGRLARSCRWDYDTWRYHRPRRQDARADKPRTAEAAGSGGRQERARRSRDSGAGYGVR